MENNSPKNRKIWFITGASKGFGLELAKQLLAKGYQVAATTRRLANLEGALGRENASFLPLEVDLINEVSVKMPSRKPSKNSAPSTSSSTMPDMASSATSRKSAIHCCANSSTSMYSVPSTSFVPPCLP